MIHADLRGKRHVEEDLLTSNCLGLLLLLPDNDLFDLLGYAVTVEGTHLNLTSYDKISYFEFWPSLSKCEPDFLAVLETGTGNAEMGLLIEVKHGSGKSGGAVLPAPTDAASNHHQETKREARFISDQLAKYCLAARQRFQSFALVYLTHHRVMPKEDLRASLVEAGNNCQLYWLSWFHWHRWVTYQLSGTKKRSVSERKILETLHDYLNEKQYSCFNGWSQLRLVDDTASRLLYARSCQTGSVREPSEPRILRYVHRYWLDEKSYASVCQSFYRGQRL